MTDIRLGYPSQPRQRTNHDSCRVEQGIASLVGRGEAECFNDFARNTLLLALLNGG